MRKSYTVERNARRGLAFLASLLDLLFATALSIAIYLSIFYPIYLNSYSGTIKECDDARKTMLRIGCDSKLMHLQSDGDSVYTLNDSYQYYVRTILRYSYESGDYDMANDSERYAEKKEEMDLFPAINVTESSFDDDFLGYFYTSFAVERGLVDSSVSAKEHYLKQVLDIEGEGKAFWKENGAGHPLLNDSTRTSLFRYNVLKLASSESGQIDRAFFAYFTKIYEEAGNLLLTMPEYKGAFDIYEADYSTLLNYKTMAFAVSASSAYLILFVIVSLFLPYRSSLGQLIFRMASLNEEGEMEMSGFLLSRLVEIVKHFPFIVPLGMVVDAQILFQNLGTSPVNLLLIALIAVLVDIVSTLLLMTKKDARSLFDLTSRTYTFRYY